MKLHELKPLFEAITVHDIEMASEYAQKLQNDLSSILNDNVVVKVTAGGGLGPDLFVSIYDKNPSNNIPDNSKIQMKFLMHLSNGSQVKDLASVSWSLTTWHYELKGRGFKFRKITSKKSIADANNKLVMWFKKHAEVINQLADESARASNIDWKARK